MSIDEGLWARTTRNSGSGGNPLALESGGPIMRNTRRLLQSMTLKAGAHMLSSWMILPNSFPLCFTVIFCTSCKQWIYRLKWERKLSLNLFFRLSNAFVPE